MFYQTLAIFSSLVILGGNPAAVVLLDDAASDRVDDATKLAIAAEMNLSETAFLQPLEPAKDSTPVWSTCSNFRLRWFTPTVEVPLCGHATLAAAAALIQGCGNSNALLRFHTLHSGELSVSRAPQPPLVASAPAADADATAATAEGERQAAQPPAQQPEPAIASSSADDASAAPVVLEMSLPLSAPVDPVPAEATAASSGSGSHSTLVRAAVGELPVQDIQFCARLGYLLVVLDGSVSRNQLEAIKPDIAGMRAAAPDGPVKAIIVAAHGGNCGYDFLSRFFGPWLGVDEDPVTGSAHAVLGPYFARVLGRNSLSARQCSRRGGDVLVAVDEAAQRVVLGGAATIVVTGTLAL